MHLWRIKERRMLTEASRILSRVDTWVGPQELSDLRPETRRWVEEQKALAERLRQEASGAHYGWDDLGTDVLMATIVCLPFVFAYCLVGKLFIQELFPAAIGTSWPFSLS